MALICRISLSAEANSGDAEWVRILTGLRQIYPEVIDSMRLDANQKREFLRKRNITLPPGISTGDLPLFSIQHPRFHQAADRFAQKLFCALYYMHCGKVLDSRGGISFFWKTNTQTSFEQQIDAAVLAMFNSKPELKRGPTSLTSQFDYSYVLTDEEQPSGMFRVRFNQGVDMVGFVIANEEHLPLFNEGTKLLFPFNWKN
jgi:hypothetical protein